MGLGPFVAIRQWFSQSYRRFAMIPFVFVLLGITVFFWVNGKSFFPGWDDTYGQLIHVYLVMAILFVLWAGRKTQEQMRRPLKNSMLVFVMFFIGTYIILLIASTVGIIKVAVSPDPSLFWPVVIMQIGVVATCEELLFRGVLLEAFGIIWQAIAFGIFHLWAYQFVLWKLNWSTANWGALIFAVIIGLILGVVAKKRDWGIPAVVAVHGCFNIFVSGYFISAQHIVGLI